MQDDDDDLDDSQRDNSDLDNGQKCTFSRAGVRFSSL